jgi:hypothetical protein
MRRWKRVVAVLLVAAVALILEGWAASAQAAPALFKKCTYTRTADGTVRPPYSLAPLVGVVKVTVQTNRGTLVLRLDRSNGALRRAQLHAPGTAPALQRDPVPAPHPGDPRVRRGSACLHLHPKTHRQRDLPPRSGCHSNSTGFFLVHRTTDLPKTSPIIGTISHGLPALDRIAASPQQPVRILTVQVG